jgi:hypothetical protein
MTPSDVQQYLLIVAFVVPGIVYQTVRARYLGEVPQNSELAAKILRALSVSTLLALTYAILFAGTVTAIIDSTPEEARTYAKAHPTKCATWAAILLFAVPVALARLNAAWPTVRFLIVAGWNWLLGKTPNDRFEWVKKRAEVLQVRVANPSGLRFEPTATAWDWAVDHAGTSDGFIRVCDAEGNWWGGAFGRTSYFSDYPEDPAIFVETAWHLSDTGGFEYEHAGSRGAWIPCKDARTVEFISAQDSEADSAPSDGSL